MEVGIGEETNCCDATIVIVGERESLMYSACQKSLIITNPSRLCIHQIILL